MAKKLDFISPSYYEAAVTLELVPAWLRFLEEHGLLMNEQRLATLAELRPLVAKAAPIWPDRTSDPALGRNIERAWEQA